MSRLLVALMSCALAAAPLAALAQPQSAPVRDSPQDKASHDSDEEIATPHGDQLGAALSGGQNATPAAQPAAPANATSPVSASPASASAASGAPAPARPPVAASAAAAPSAVATPATAAAPAQPSRAGGPPLWLFAAVGAASVLASVIAAMLVAWLVAGQRAAAAQRDAEARLAQRCDELVAAASRRLQDEAAALAKAAVPAADPEVDARRIQHLVKEATRQIEAQVRPLLDIEFVRFQSDLSRLRQANAATAPPVADAGPPAPGAEAAAPAAVPPETDDGGWPSPPPGEPTAADDGGWPSPPAEPAAEPAGKP